MMGWYKEFLTHYNVGVGAKRTGVTCLQFWDEVCPVCEHIKELQDSADAADLNLANEMRVQVKYLVNAVKKNEPDALIKPWSLTQNLFGEICGQLMHPELARFTHPTLGYDLTVT